MPKVSVVIPVYNAELYIERCVRSLFEQTLDDIEYIFVDDCSKDNSMHILQTILNEYPRRQRQVVIIYHSVNTGQGGARRDGMEAATGDYIIHCDADDWVDLDAYEKMYNRAIETSADTVCCDMVMEYYNYTKYLKYNSDYDDHRLMIDCIAPITVEYFSLCNRLVSRKIYEQHTIAPLTGINVWEDVGMSTRIRYFAKKCVVINQPLYHYNRQNEDSTSRMPSFVAVPYMCACAQALEDFFVKEGSQKKYKRFIALLKLIAKLAYINYNQDQWRTTFPETRKYLYLIKERVPKKTLIYMFLLAYLGKWGWEVYQFVEPLLDKVKRYRYNSIV